MDRKKFINLIKGLKSAYPNFKMIESKEAMEMWFAMLQDIEYPALSIAVQKHIATSKYPPSIAEIRELASVKESIKDWSEGYGYLKRAIKIFGYYKETEAIEWLNEKDPLTAKIVKRLDYKTICTSEDEMVDRANFRMAYSNEQKNENWKRQLPESLREDKQLEDNRKTLDEMMKMIG